MPLAGRSDPLAHGQQFEHFEPGHLGLAVGQTLAPERAELQFIPQTASQPREIGPMPTLWRVPVVISRGQPAIAEEARMLERQLGELDLEAVEHVQTLAPGRLLRVIDLPADRQVSPR